ncbi:MAG TPA: sigma-54 dependent transcriptional regulator [Bryobacteraceae bacterium]|jgi:two-component system nitrogen regulation response regulator NtrX|nr:sigma-54 dependent transcriptional regulator [Bryobacteraceae bacterium]
MAQKRILIVDDEVNIGRSLKLILEREGYAVTVCLSIAEARAHPHRPDAYLVDVRLPDGSGIDFLRWLRTNDVEAPILMISGHGTIADAVEATRAGAFDFLEKPLSRDKVLLSLKHALDQSKLREENRRLREIAGSPRMIGSCAAFERVLDQATMAARSDARVLLTGESGTGKELLAAHLHAESPFANGPFVKVNCAAIPTELIESELFGHEKGAFTGATAARRGKFELADGGTLFLDEVGDLHAASQAKLLRVLQEGEFHRVGGEQAIKVSVRVISATNRDLQELVTQQKFREDLYYRLCVVPVRVPALRERREDIAALAEYFLAEFCARNNFKPKCLDRDVTETLEDHHWPGNIRELRNTVERMAILTRGDLLTADSIPVEIRLSRGAAPPKGNLREAKESAEREHILRALDEAKWNVSSAARALGMERTNLHKRIRALGLARER